MRRYFLEETCVGWIDSRTFDLIADACSHNMCAVLIDSGGRCTECQPIHHVNALFKPLPLTEPPRHQEQRQCLWWRPVQPRRPQGTIHPTALLFGHCLWCLFSAHVHSLLFFLTRCIQCVHHAPLQEAKLISSFFSYFYMSINIGSLFSSTALVYVRCPHRAY